MFQRTPNFSLPANNDKLTPEKVQDFKERFAEIKEEARRSAAGIPIQVNEQSVLEASPEERARAFETGWEQGGFHLTQAYIDLLATDEANATVAEFVRSKIREVVKDPSIADALAPHDHPLGTKRICIDTDYYSTYNRDDVTLVDIRKTPIEEITPRGIRANGQEYELDAIVFATGFDAMTGALLGMNIRGTGGQELKEKWAAGPRTYLGVSVAGLPEPVHDYRPGQPFGAEQHDDLDRTARGVDRRLHCVHARARDR